MVVPLSFGSRVYRVADGRRDDDEEDVLGSPSESGLSCKTIAPHPRLLTIYIGIKTEKERTNL